MQLRKVAETVSASGQKNIANNTEETTDQKTRPVDSDNEKSDHQKLISRISELQSIIDQQSQELVHQAAYDSQTGLPTRLLFEDRTNQAISQAMRQGSKIVVLSIAVDAFKRVRDTFGTQLQQKSSWYMPAHRLAQVLRSTDTIAALNRSTNKRTTISRISPDEFGILITDIDSVEPVTWIIKRIINSLAQTANVNDNEISLASYIVCKPAP